MMIDIIKEITERVVGPINWMRIRLVLHKDKRKSIRYDLLTYQIIRKCLSKKSVCIDIGCHKGSILKVMMRYAPQGFFYAFEPLPHLVESLRKHFSKTNCRIFEIALSDTVGSSRFVHVVSNPGYSGFLRRRYDRDNEQVTEMEVRSDLLDNVIEKDRKIDFIKIDVEGAEYRVLLGGVNLIKRWKPIILFECGLGASDYYGTKPENIYDLLSDECGLKISMLDQFLRNKEPLSKLEFKSEYDLGSSYYFVAYPG